MTEAVPCPACGGSGFVDPIAGPANDRTASDRDQTANDDDQTWSDHDQSASDRDQRSADEDQEASDDDFAAGSDPLTHQRTTLARARSSRDRRVVSDARDETAAERLQIAEDRDRSAELRDRGAEARDRVARLCDAEDEADASRDDILLRAERDRARAAADRAKAADDRLRAAADRKEAARQRAEARLAGTEARDALELAATDELTGVWSRRFGLAEVAREIERARRTGCTLTLAFVDVDGLKEVNDTAGHPAGDRLLHLVAKTLRANMRSYDVIVRHGGDEFLCAMPNVTLDGARSRLEQIAARLTAVDERHSIAFGLAAHEAGDGLEELIGRADVELLNVRRRRQNGPP
jgi:diguanylate cyclase (GGDEF)-like protein